MEGAAIGHNNVDGLVRWVYAFFHRLSVEIHFIKLAEFIHLDEPFLELHRAGFTAEAADDLHADTRQSGFFLALVAEGLLFSHCSALVAIRTTNIRPLLLLGKSQVGIFVIMVVIKFGGAVLGSSAESFRRMTEMLGTLPGGLVVVSALNRTTQDLADAAELAQQQDVQGAFGIVEAIVAAHRSLADELHLTPEIHDHVLRLHERLFSEFISVLRSIAVTRHLSPRTRDRIKAYGEDLAVVLVQAALQHAQVNCSRVDARTWLVSSPDHGAATPLLDQTQEQFHRIVTPLLRPGAWVVTQGYVAATHDGITTTMGKESSNLTATVAGLMMQAEQIIIVTDVAGVRSADPHLVSHTELRPTLSFQQARIAAQHGVKLLYPTMIEPAERAGIPIMMHNLYGPVEEQTVIGAQIGAQIGARIGPKAELSDALPTRPIVSLITPTTPEAPYRIALVCITVPQWIGVLQRLLEQIPDLPISVASNYDDEWLELTIPQPWEGSVAHVLQLIHTAMLQAADRHPHLSNQPSAST